MLKEINPKAEETSRAGKPPKQPQHANATAGRLPEINKS
jgi:hypothetical protein